MKYKLLMLCTGFLFLILGSAIVAEDNSTDDQYTLWIGTNYTDYTDFTKKVGEYMYQEDDLLPEAKISYLSRRPGSIFWFDAHYLDQDDMRARVKSTVGDRFKLDFQYNSFTRQRVRDLLENMSAREALGFSPGDSIQKPGGKMFTHEIQDPNGDYSIVRNEVSSKIEYLVSKEHKVRLFAAHRSIMESGNTQAIGSNHCASCHQVSMEARVDRKTNHLEAGLEAEAKGYDLGYKFAYRLFESDAPVPYLQYDNAEHPTKGTMDAEFGSRLIYDGTPEAFSVEPKTEKMSHKLRLKGDVAGGRLASSLTYSHTENKGNDLVSNAVSGSANYSLLLSPRSRLITKVYGAKFTADDPFIDIPSWREGATSGSIVDFDFTRYSSLDRTEGRLSTELITRLNPRTVVTVSAGYSRINRKDYPVVDEGQTTSKLTAEGKVRYRKGMKLSATAKYRFEKTTDPWQSGRGLFEARGRELLQKYVSDPTKIPPVFYYERESLRYQSITTLPTQDHEIKLGVTLRPNMKTSVNLGLTGKFDKNTELDSLDVKHLAFQPNLSLTMTPDPKFSVSAGYTYNFSKSRGPVAVALFDG